MTWYRVTRTYIVEQDVYVRARTQAEAQAKVADGDWESEGAENIVRYSKRPKASAPLDGVPRWVWEDLDYPDDVKIAS